MKVLSALKEGARASQSPFPNLLCMYYPRSLLFQGGVEREKMRGFISFIITTVGTERPFCKLEVVWIIHVGFTSPNKDHFIRDNVLDPSARSQLIKQ